MARGIRQFALAVVAITLAACLTALLLTSHNPRHSSPGSSSPGSTAGWLSLSKPPDRNTGLSRLSVSEPPDAASEPAILEHWDHQRAAAYASGNASALQRLYVPGSQAGLRDVQLLKSYVARGLLVTGMKMRLLSARVIHSDPRRLVLLVRDQLARAIARAEKERDVHRTLPTDHASSHVVTLSRSGTDQTWRVSTVRVSGGRRRPGR